MNIIIFILTYILTFILGLYIGGTILLKIEKEEYKWEERRIDSLINQATETKEAFETLKSNVEKTINYKEK